MLTKAEQFVQYLTQIIGREPDQVVGTEADPTQSDMIYGIAFQNYPEAGLLTGFTYGLSVGQHPDWKDIRPELSITVASQDIDWIKALVYLLEWNRPAHAFLPGSLFHYGQAVAPDSAMDSFLVFNLAIGQGEQFRNIQLDEEKVTLHGVHPLYHDEVAMLQKVGIRKFMGLPEYQLFSVTRPDLSALYKINM